MTAVRLELSQYPGNMGWNQELSSNGDQWSVKMHKLQLVKNCGEFASQKLR